MYSCQKQVSFQWRAVTFSERTPTTNSFLTKIKKSDDRHVQRIRHEHDRRSYLSLDVGCDSHSRLELKHIRSKDRGLLSYNIDVVNRNSYSLFCKHRHDRENAPEEGTRDVRNVVEQCTECHHRQNSPEDLLHNACENMP